jgi:hypothetical protein
MVRVRGYDREHDRYLTETRYQRAGQCTADMTAAPASACGSRLGLVFDDMSQGRLADCARNVRPFRGPIPEGTAESVGGDVIVPETTQEHQKHHVG